MIKVTGAEVKAMRAVKQWATKDIADRVGVSRRTVEGWEQGRAIPMTASIILRTIMHDEVI